MLWNQFITTVELKRAELNSSTQALFFLNLILVSVLRYNSQYMTVLFTLLHRPPSLPMCNMKTYLCSNPIAQELMTNIHFKMVDDKSCHFNDD